jgi:glycosyltransferase involved in cell wall biosynthesis
MIIGIDGNDANVEKKVGVSVYTWELLARFQKKASGESVCYVYLKDQPRADMPPETAHFKYLVVKGKIAWSRVWLPLHFLLRRSKPDVFFSPAHYSPLWLPCPLVVTIHDLAYIYFPDEFLKKDQYKLFVWTKESVDKAKIIITVSKSTKDDVIKHYHIPEDQVQVIYNGFQSYPRAKDDERILKKYGVDKQKYLFFVGTLQSRKNIVRLIEAFHALRSTYPDLLLLLSGRRGWLYDKMLERIQQLHLGDYVRELGFVPDADLASLYAHAQCFVLPSLYEGFGIPVLEAMAQGTPVVASNNSSLPEIGGEACLYVDAHDTMQIATAIERILTDKELQRSLIMKGKVNVKRFSWDTCASETFALLKQVAYER